MLSKFRPSFSRLAGRDLSKLLTPMNESKIPSIKVNEALLTPVSMRAFGSGMEAPTMSAPNVHAVLQEDKRTYWEIEDKTSIAFTLGDQPGILQRALEVFTQHGINLTRIQSRPPKIISGEKQVEFYADFDGKLADPKISGAIETLKGLANKVIIVGTPEVPWFPTHIDDFNNIGKRILSSGDGI